MRRPVTLISAITVLALCVGAATYQDDAPALERPGTFVPAMATSISLEFDAYQGELRLLSVLPHGTFVNKGDVIATLDREAIQKQIEAAQSDLRSTALQHESTVARAQIDDEAAQQRLDDTRAALERAREQLKGWLEYELEFSRRGSDLQAQYTQHSIEDQEDELRQLEAMYRDDELTDATEEIVLRRSRRNLARSKVSQSLSQERRKYTDTFEVKAQTDAKRRAVKSQEGALGRLIRTQRLDTVSREDGIRRSKEGMDKKREHLDNLGADLELFQVRAPETGILVHGASKNYKPGRVAPRHEVGGALAPRSTAFSIMKPDQYEVALDIPESKLLDVKEGMAVEVTPAFNSETTWVGRLKMDRFPTPSSAAGPENAYEARVVFDRALTGLVPGMRATVRPATTEAKTEAP